MSEEHCDVSVDLLHSCPSAVPCPREVFSPSYAFEDLCLRITVCDHLHRLALMFAIRPERKEAVQMSGWNTLFDVANLAINIGIEGNDLQEWCYILRVE